MDMECPMACGDHFYSHFIVPLRDIAESVNALNRAGIISTHSDENAKKIMDKVSMP